MKKIFLLASSLGFLGSLSSQAVTAVLNFVPDADVGSSIGHAADPASPFVFSTGGEASTAPVSLGVDGTNGTGRGSFIDLVLTDTIGGTTFTGNYSVSLTIAESGGTVARGGVGAIGLTNTITLSGLTLNFISGDDVFEVEGFSGVYFGATSGTETDSINGVVVTPEAAGNSIEASELISFSDVVGVDSILTSVAFATETGVTSLHGVEASFVAVVPEPSSVALLGLGGLALLRRRR